MAARARVLVALFDSRNNFKCSKIILAGPKARKDPSYIYWITHSASFGYDVKLPCPVTILVKLQHGDPGYLSPGHPDYEDSLDNEVFGNISRLDPLLHDLIKKYDGNIQEDYFCSECKSMHRPQARIYSVPASLIDSVIVHTTGTRCLRITETIIIEGHDDIVPRQIETGQ